MSEGARSGDIGPGDLRPGESSEARARSGPEPNRELGEVRSELRRLGYLDHSVERYLLQDALRPERPVAAMWRLTAKVGGLIGTPAALLTGLVLAAVNGHLGQSPFDLLPLFLHLLPPVVLTLAAGFLALAALLVVLLRVRHVRRIEGISFGMAMLTALAGVVVALWQGYGFLPVLPRWQVAALLLAMPFMAWAVLEVVHGGLLTLAIRLTDLAPEKPSSHGRWIVLGLVLATFLGMLPVALDAGRRVEEGPPGLPTSDRSLTVIGVDGVLATEVDFLLGAGELPALAAALDAGAVLLPYARRAGAAPSSFWTTVSSGVDAPEHGMESLDSFRPVGVSRPLLRSGLLRPYWSLLSRLGLAEYRPVLSSHRAAWAFWELAGRGGSDAVAVNWWGTFPAEATAGATVAHGAFQILADGATGGAVEPASILPAMRLLAADVREEEGAVPEALVDGLRRVLPEDDVQRILDRALRPSVFYRRAVSSLLARRPETRLVALYLPALDIASGLADPGSIAMSEMVRWQMRSVDRLLADVPMETAELGAVVVVFDPGRRGAGDPLTGRVLIWTPEGCSRAAEGALTLEDLALEDLALENLAPKDLGAIALRLAGLPQSGEIGEPPAVCRWPAPPLTVPSYGPRHPARQEERSDEYLEQLRSLGYL